jgi:hypothetical protein
MSRTLLAALALATVAACGRSDRQDVAAADSLSRDLQLAPVDTTAELNDQPAAGVEHRQRTETAEKGEEGKEQSLDLG